MFNPDLFSIFYYFKIDGGEEGEATNNFESKISLGSKEP